MVSHNKTSGDVEGPFAALVAVGVSCMLAALSYSLQCSGQYACIQDGRCRATGPNTCSFANSVTPAAFELFNMSFQSGDALSALTRGVCSPGERQVANKLGNHVQCARALVYPNAYVREIADFTGLKEHQKACGAWINAKASVTQTETFAFYDATQVQMDVAASIREQVAIGGGISDVARFQRVCIEMLVNSVVTPSTMLAYEFLKREIGAVETRTDAIRRIGMLSSFYCDTPTAVGISFHPRPTSTFSVFVDEGVLLDENTAIEALYSIGEPHEVGELAKLFVSELRSAPAALVDRVTGSELNELINGAVNGSALVDSMEITSPIAVSISGGSSSQLLSKFLYAYEETSPKHAEAYLLAAASQCASSVRSIVTGEFGSLSSAVESTAGHIRKRRRKMSSLGRLAFDEQNMDRFTPVNATDVFEASSATWSSLTRKTTALYETNPARAASVCFDAASIAFADALDHAVFDNLVSKRFVGNTLPGMIEEIKQAVANEIENGDTKSLIASSFRTQLANDARNVEFRIAGAPRTSTYGRDEKFQRPDLSSQDGALLMMLKQGRAVFLDRIQLAIENSPPCQHPSLMPSSSRNAYLLTAAPCAMILPGMLTAPFVDDRFNEESLFGKIGFVLAHEVAHVASDQQKWDQTAASALLINYTYNTWVEAAADLTAAEALFATGKFKNVDELCKLLSQTWCGRVPPGGVGSGTSHPPANLRGDNMCAFLKR